MRKKPVDAYTSSNSQSIEMPSNYCATVSEASLAKIWICDNMHKPNLRTRLVMWMMRLGVGVKRFDNVDDMFRELKK
jgi:hypothetical protein